MKVPAPGEDNREIEAAEKAIWRKKYTIVEDPDDIDIPVDKISRDKYAAEQSPLVLPAVLRVFDNPRDFYSTKTMQTQAREWNHTLNIQTLRSRLVVGR